MTDSDKMALRAARVAEICRPHFAGLSPIIQGAALADMVSRWLAGHLIRQEGTTGPIELDRADTDEFREATLAHWLSVVRELLPTAEAEILKSTDRRKIWDARALIEESDQIEK